MNSMNAEQFPRENHPVMRKTYAYAHEIEVSDLEIWHDNGDLRPRFDAHWSPDGAGRKRESRDSLSEPAHRAVRRVAASVDSPPPSCLVFSAGHGGMPLPISALMFPRRAVISAARATAPNGESRTRRRARYGMGFNHGKFVVVLAGLKRLFLQPHLDSGDHLLQLVLGRNPDCSNRPVQAADALGGAGADVRRCVLP
jgi:hypothetical protein